MREGPENVDDGVTFVWSYWGQGDEKNELRDVVDMLKNILLCDGSGVE